MEKLVKYFLVCLAAVIVGNLLLKVIDHKFDYLKQELVKPSVFSTLTLEKREQQLECLARNIYFEAAKEPFEGKVAVAQVTINRAESGKFPSDICDVVFQKTKFTDRVVCQFTWYCDRGPKIPEKNAAYFESHEVAKKVLLENFRLSSLTHAMYYHADYVNPNWKLPRITKIGKHIFYGEKV